MDFNLTIDMIKNVEVIGDELYITLNTGEPSCVITDGEEFLFPNIFENTGDSNTIILKYMTLSSKCHSGIMYIISYFRNLCNDTNCDPFDNDTVRECMEIYQFAELIEKKKGEKL